MTHRIPVTFSVRPSSCLLKEGRHEIRTADLSGDHAAAPFKSLERAVGSGTEVGLRGLRGDQQDGGRHAGASLGLPDAARTVQVREGKPQVKNGLHLAEGVGGYFVFEAENMEAAIALAARIPAARLGGAVEVRPAEQYW